MALALTPDLGLTNPDQAYGFDSHVIVRRSPQQVWATLTDPTRWSRFSDELRVGEVDADAARYGARWQLGPVRPLRRATVIVSEPPEELVLAATYFGTAVRHGLRCEPYWHDDEDEDAPATSCRVVHSLVSFGASGRLLASLGGLRELENRFHRFNEAMRRHLEQT